MNDEPAQRPGGGIRLGFLLAAVSGFVAVFSVGFPPAARDRLPLLLLALGLALVSAWSPGRGLALFAFCFPLAGAGARLFGGSDPIAWPILLFAGFAAGWTFRYLYDFESVADPSPVDSVLRTLTAVWVLAAALAAVSARTLWALLRGLSLRAVNVQGLLDAAAIRESVLGFAALASGAGFFFILRRSGPAVRDRVLGAALSGVAVSAALALGQRAGVAPAETNGFWKLTGRLSGGAVDPNALGMLCGMAAVVALGRLFSAIPAIAVERRGGAVRWAVTAALCAAGLALSGSRSGLLVAGLGVAFLLFSAGRFRRRLAVLAAGAALLAVVAVAARRGAPGTTGTRLSELLDPSLPAEYKTSARPLLWDSAVRLFRRHPIEGAGLGAFSWQLPDLLAETGRSLPIRDNPGSAYLQALAETGLVGLVLTLAFAIGLARFTFSGKDGTGGAVTAFLIALAIGSHWLAADVSLGFFLLASVAAASTATAPDSATSRARTVGRGRRWRAALVALYAIAASVASLSTLRADFAFRHRRGIGFHEKEVGAGGPFYWTQRRFAIFLTPGMDMRLSLAHFTPEGRPVELVAESGGRRVYTHTFQPGQGVSLRLNGAAEGSRVIRFTVSRAFVPKRLGLSSDRRELGLVAVFPKT
ncbi:MAG TPA: O-antigen ligase family protein [Thermoanaerobaculia bacterium]